MRVRIKRILLLKKLPSSFSINLKLFVVGTLGEVVSERLKGVATYELRYLY